MFCCCGGAAEPAVILARARLGSDFSTSWKPYNTRSFKIKNISKVTKILNTTKISRTMKIARFSFTKYLVG